ncbi:hypothetical protein TcasGA2_TC001435 [Tribolium castaneum]|uniref:Uncharacterized protein n=1 Tax=Tribolium castaneum TaxID=7070 RepID=D7EIL7_TRICA|nr:hypothetical protein TcasGA2_TC001435 [Tribolium castaneum]
MTRFALGRRRRCAIRPDRTMPQIGPHFCLGSANSHEHLNRWIRYGVVYKCVRSAPAAANQGPNVTISNDTHTPCILPDVQSVFQ